MADTDNMMSATELFDLSLEIEGLLSLVMRREDMVPQEVYQLLSDKTSRFAEGIQALASDNGCAEESAPSSRAAQEKEFVASLPSLPGLFDYDAPSAEDVTIVAEPEEVRAPDENPTEPDPEEPVEELDGSAEESAPDEEMDNLAEIANGVDAAPSEAEHRHQPGELRRLFTVNDKFRFRRELFGNSDTEFTDTLNLVEAMRNYSEAEEYFYTDLGWDAEAIEVSEFMAVVNRYFSR